jgi:hypothetical protein
MKHAVPKRKRNRVRQVPRSELRLHGAALCDHRVRRLHELLGAN